MELRAEPRCVGQPTNPCLVPLASPRIRVAPEIPPRGQIACQSAVAETPFECGSWRHLVRQGPGEATCRPVFPGVARPTRAMLAGGRRTVAALVGNFNAPKNNLVVPSSDVTVARRFPWFACIAHPRLALLLHRHGNGVLYRRERTWAFNGRLAGFRRFRFPHVRLQRSAHPPLHHQAASAQTSFHARSTERIPSFVVIFSNPSRTRSAIVPPGSGLPLD